MLHGASVFTLQRDETVNVVTLKTLEVAMPSKKSPFLERQKNISEFTRKIEDKVITKK